MIFGSPIKSCSLGIFNDDPSSARSVIKLSQANEQTLLGWFFFVQLTVPCCGALIEGQLAARISNKMKNL